MALFNDEISKAFDGNLWLPFLGWLLLPYTTLSYVLLNWYLGSVDGFAWAFVGLGFVLDLGSYAGNIYKRPPTSPAVVRYEV